MWYFYRCGCDTWSMALRVDCRLGLGTVLVLINTCTLMVECNRIVEKTAYCVASLTDCICHQILLEFWKRESKVTGLLMWNDCDMRHVYMQLHEMCVHAVTWDVCTCSYMRRVHAVTWDVYMQLHEMCVHAVTWDVCTCSYMRCVYMQLYKTCTCSYMRCVYMQLHKTCTCSYMRCVYMQLHETCVHAVTSLIIMNNQLCS